MSWHKKEVAGRVMWESTNGERSRNLNDEKTSDMYGWRKIDVEGRMMWESPEGERRF